MLTVLLYWNLAFGAAVGSDCSPSSFDFTLKNGRVTEMQQSCFKNLNIQQVSENIYIQNALNSRSDNLSCIEKTIMKVTEDPNLSFRYEVLIDLEKKSVVLGKLKKELVGLTAARGRLAMPLQKEEINQNDQQMDRIRQAIELTYQSLFMGSTSEIRDLVDMLAADTKNLLKNLKSILLNTTLAKVSKNLTKQKSEINQLINSKNSPSPEIYKSLVRDNSILPALLAGKKDDEIQFLTSAHCSLDKKYGLEKEQSDQRKDLALNAAAMLIPVSTGFALLKFAGTKVLQAAGIARGAKILAFGASGALGLVAANDELERSCGIASRDITLSSKESCLVNKNTTQVDMINNLEKQNCFYAGLMQTLMLAPGLGFELNAIAKQQKIERLANPRDVASYYSKLEEANLKKYSREVSDRLEKLQNSGDPHAQYLKSLGITSAGTQPPNKIFKAIDSQLDKRVFSGELKENEILRPVRIYELKSGKLAALDPIEVVPTGAVPRTRLLSDRDYWQLLGEGKFPIGETLSSTAYESITLGPPFFHDMSHFSGFSRSPDYMKAMREVAPIVAKMSDYELEKAQPGLFYISEMMSAFPKGSEDQIKIFIRTLRPLKSDVPFEQKEYVELLSKKSDAQLKVLWQRSQTGLPKMESYGGLSSDQISKTTPDRTGRLAPLEQAFEGGMNVFTFDKSFDRKRMIDSLSTRLAIADHLKSTSVGQMVKDVALFKTNSPIVKLICSTYGIIPDLSSNTACAKAKN